jgi:DivIVA domain-containing protein
MPFAPHEIQNKKFVVGLRGYATHEVDAFLRAVAADYAALLEAHDRGSGVVAREPEPTPADGWVAQMRREIEGFVALAWDEAVEIRRKAEQEAAGLIASARREATSGFAAPPVEFFEDLSAPLTIEQ